MKKLNLVIDLEGIGKDDKRTPQEVAITIIENIMLNYGEQQKPTGLSEVERRLFYKITDVFAVARKDKLESVDLDDDWLNFIRKCFRVNLMPNKVLQKVERLIELAAGGDKG